MAINNIEVVVQQAVTTSQVGLVAAGIAAGATIIVAIFNVFMSKSINEYKNKLDTELATHTSNLQKTLNEHEIKFSKMHERRAEVIEELYNKLFALELALRQFDYDGTSKEEVLNKFYDLKKFYQSKIIFFSAESPINVFLKEISDMTAEATAKGQSLFPGNYYALPDSVINTIIQGQEKSRQLIYTEIPALRQKLEQEFRELLGVK